jgi:hypothetical protein
MKKKSILTVSLIAALALGLAFSTAGMAGEKSRQTVITGTIYCVDITGKMVTKAGICPAEHVAHVLITDDGRAVMLGGGEKVEKLIRNIALPAGTRVSIRGELVEELSAIQGEELLLNGGAAGGP